MGERIKELRKSKGMTQEELGALIGVKKAAVLKYEKGIVKNLKQSSIMTLSDFFEVSPAYLMGYEDVKDATTNMLLTNTEKEIIEDYRKMTPEQRKTIYTFLKFQLVSNEKDV